MKNLKKVAVVAFICGLFAESEGMNQSPAPNAFENAGAQIKTEEIRLNENAPKNTCNLSTCHRRTPSNNEPIALMRADLLGGNELKCEENSTPATHRPIRRITRANRQDSSIDVCGEILNTSSTANYEDTPHVTFNFEFNEEKINADCRVLSDEIADLEENYLKLKQQMRDLCHTIQVQESEESRLEEQINTLEVKHEKNTKHLQNEIRQMERAIEAAETEKKQFVARINDQQKNLQLKKQSSSDVAERLRGAQASLRKLSSDYKKDKDSIRYSPALKKVKDGDKKAKLEQLDQDYKKRKEELELNIKKLQQEQPLAEVNFEQQRLEEQASELNTSFKEIAFLKEQKHALELQLQALLNNSELDSLKETKRTLVGNIERLWGEEECLFHELVKFEQQIGKKKTKRDELLSQAKNEVKKRLELKQEKLESSKLLSGESQVTEESQMAEINASDKNVCSELAEFMSYIEVLLSLCRNNENQKLSEGYSYLKKRVYDFASKGLFIPNWSNLPFDLKGLDMDRRIDLLTQFGQNVYHTYKELLNGRILKISVPE